MIDPNVTPFLFSVVTNIAYRIAKDYYGNVQYVWCAPKFNSLNQPPTSNPLTIAKRYIEQIKSGDRHTNEIDANKAGILRGVKAKQNDNVIDAKQNREIRSIVAYAKYEDFFPVLFVIDTRKVIAKCNEVEVENRATNSSQEYLITDLLPGEYELIDFKKLFDGVINFADIKAGE